MIPLPTQATVHRPCSAPRFGESVSPPGDRENRQLPASEDRDDVLGSAVEATNNPLAGVWFSWRSELAQKDTQGFIVSDNLLPQKARILMMLALTVTSERDQLQQYFYEY